MDRLELEDVIVIMGAAVWKGGVASKAMRRRVEGGIASARSLANPTFLVTGGTGRYPPSEARVMERLVLERERWQRGSVRR